MINMWNERQHIIILCENYYEYEINTLFFFCIIEYDFVKTAHI